MREIPLVNGRGVALVDDEDYERLCQHRWFLSSRGYAVRNENYKQPHMHHDVLSVKTGFLVDHANRNKLDNRRANLRYVTPQQSNRNRGSLGGASGFKGVARASNGNQWRAYIYIDRHQHYIGGFPTAIAAALAYNAEAIRLFGEHAALNEVPGLDGEPSQLVAVLDHQHS